MKLIVHNDVSDATAKRVAAAVLEGTNVPAGFAVNEFNGDLIIEPLNLTNINILGDINDDYREIYTNEKA